MRKLFILLVLGFFSILPVQAAFFIIHDELELKLLKTTGSSPYYKPTTSILRDARKILSEPIPSVTEKTLIPPSGDIHDYVSLAIYYWPNPETPERLPYISKDGYVNPEKDDVTRYDGKRLDKMTYNVNKLALAYYLTNDEVFAAKAIEILDAWFINPNKRMNPNLNFGQIRPGKSAGGSSSGIIETAQLITLIDSINMLKTSAHFTQRQQSAIKDWFSKYLDWLRNSTLGKKEAAAANNHAVWYDAQTAAYAYFIGQDNLVREIVSKVPEKRIASQIEPDGTMPRELARTRAKHYTLFTLKAFTNLARVGDSVNINLWDYQTADRRSIKGAWDWFIPYIAQEKDWPYNEVGSFSVKDFAYYLKLANLHYKNKEYTAAITKILAQKAK